MNSEDNTTTNNKFDSSYIYKIGDISLPYPLKFKHLMTLVFTYIAWVFLSFRVALLFSNERTGFFVAVLLAIGVPVIAVRAYRSYRERSTTTK